jgi:thiamine-monophosphate kinase
MGEVAPNLVMTRSGAKPGDRIFVTGKVGESGAGYHVLEKYGIDYPHQFEPLVQKHLQPIPRIEIGKRIAQSGVGTAMIDISDGIASDLNHICTMSSVGAEIYQDKLPLPAHIKAIESLSGKSALDLALHAGEDYELLFTTKSEIPISKIESMMKETDVSITEIGQLVTKESGYYLIDSNRKKSPLHPKGWDHFSR